MNAITDDDEEQIESTDEPPLTVGGESPSVTEAVEGEEMGEMFPTAEYELEVGQTTVTDNETDEQYTLWKAVGRPVGVQAGEVEELSPHLPEAIMGVCEALKRNAGDL